MAIVALVTWVVAALGGLYLLAIWLIEYDPDFQQAAATRLPGPVLAGHVLFAVGGLVAWVVYLLTDRRIYSWLAAGALVLVAGFGLTMAVRWIGVYRTRPLRDPGPAARYPAEPETHQAGRAGQAGAVGTPSPAGQARPGELAVPPERYFPVPVVVAHGIFAVTTLILVVLTTLLVGRR